LNWLIYFVQNAQGCEQERGLRTIELTPKIVLRHL
jgi:hypothetical protein